MKRYFRLNAYCHLVSGAKNGCIYNLISKTMIILSKENYEVLKLCEENYELNEIPSIDLEFIDTLNTMGVGLYYETKVYIDKLMIGVPKELEAVIDNSNHIKCAYLELSTQCNFDCFFCQKNDSVLFRKIGCKRWNIENKIEDCKWKDIIKQLCYLQCKQLVFIGGEPFLKYELLKELCMYALENGIYDITIYTNASVITDNMIAFLKKYKIKLVIQVLAYYNKTYENIVGIPNIGQRVFDNIQAFIKDNIEFKILYLLNNQNENEADLILKKYEKQISKARIEIMYLYPVLKNNFYSTKVLDIIYDSKEKLKNANITAYKFSERKKYHTCYGNQIGITANGFVIPCIMSRDFILGNIRDKKISEILNTPQFEYYKNLNKDKIKTCKTCSLRYGCFDCRALEYAATKDVLGMEFCNIKS